MGILKAKESKLRAKTIGKLIENIKFSCEISERIFVDTFNSIKDRVRLCIERAGDALPY